MNIATRLLVLLSVATTVHVINRDLTAGEPLQIGSRLELFVDDFLIDEMTGGLSLQLHSPRPAEIVLRYEMPWEDRWSYYSTVFRDEDRYRMYYRGGLGDKGIPGQICYAESTDGIHWERPELGLIEFNGSKQNNIVWNGVGTHCALGVFKDGNPNCQPNERYKALSSDGYKKPVYAFGSPDGIRWHLIQEEPVITEYSGDRVVAAYDCLFSTRWDPVGNQYVLFHRIWYRPVDPKVRSVATRTSSDFIHWSPLQRLDFGDTPPEHLYTNGITHYSRAPHILIGFPKRFSPTRRRLAESEADGVSDTVFISSRDGLHFDRRFMESFIRPGLDRLNWLDRSNLVAAGVLQTSPQELSLYVCQHYRHPTAHLRRFVLRTDGFVSVHTTYSGGEFLTKPLVFEGQELALNYSTSAAGTVRVELTDAGGQAVPGFELESCPEIYGDEIEQVVEWDGQPDLAKLAGKPVRLRFQLKDADLYSIRFRMP